MATFTNKSSGTLVLPDGTEVAHGDKVTISKDDLDHSAISNWISTGWLDDGKPAEAKKSASGSKD